MKKGYKIWLLFLVLLALMAAIYGIGDYLGEEKSQKLSEKVWKETYESDTRITDAPSYDEFADVVTELIREYDGESGSGKAIEDTYYSRRLIIQGEAELDLDSYGADVVISGPDHLYVMQFSDKEKAQTVCEQLQTFEGIVYCEPDVYVQTTENMTGEEAMSWGVQHTGADVYAAKLQGETEGEVIVAVVDTGVFRHSFLEGKILDKGKDFVEGDLDPNDQNSHGTHVAGTIVDCTSGLNVKILPVKVFGENGSGSMLQVSLGVRYAAYKGSHVINLSLGGIRSNYLDETIRYTVGKGCVVVAAAGNDNQDTVWYSPAHLEECIVVSAVDQDEKKASFSNQGESVDVAAPGVDVVSCVPKLFFGYNLGEGTASMSGTSMAAPHVSAFAAMIRLEHPEYTVEEVEKELLSRCRDLGDEGWDPEYGWGILDYTAVNEETAEVGEEESQETKESQEQPQEKIMAEFLAGIAGKYYAVLPVGENGGDVIIVTDNPQPGGETVTSPTFTPHERGYSFDIYVMSGDQINYAGTKHGRISNGPWFVYQHKITCYGAREGYDYLEIRANGYEDVHVEVWPENFEENQEMITLTRA